MANLLATVKTAYEDIDSRGITACWGASSSDLSGQVQRTLEDLSTLRQSQDADALVSITIGANDFKWLDFDELGELMCSKRESFMGRVTSTTALISSNIRNEIQRLISRENVYVVLTDYYNPMNTESHLYRMFLVPGSPLFQPECQKEGLSLEALYNRGRFALSSLNAALRETSTEFDSARVRLASVYESFRGRESAMPYCGTAAPDLSVTWIQTDCFHPNEKGTHVFGITVASVARQILPLPNATTHAPILADAEAQPLR